MKSLRPFDARKVSWLKILDIKYSDGDIKKATNAFSADIVSP